MNKLATGFRFTEGPFWHNDGYLLISDMPANRIYKIRSSGSVEVFLEKSGFSGNDSSDLSDMIGSNAIAMDPAGKLLLCRQGDHCIARLEDDFTCTVLTGRYDGRPFNSPNDMVVRKDGGIYFSDPPYGLKDQVPAPSKFQPGGGVYFYKDGITTLVSTDLRYPNGLCFSPDEQILFIGSNHPDEPFILQYRIAADGSLHDGRPFISQNADGIKADEQGNLYLATGEGILVVNREGKRLALTPIPEMPTNLTFGGPGRQLLFITAEHSVYTLSLFK
ncbi:MAG: SMP-30/gluconolactonase/LRE family protein [Bacteroidetes bacterium]|nr:SMP-30/gluconolactonase/LRE family protein [Bacteroidota bacterium]